MKTFLFTVIFILLSISSINAEKNSSPEIISRAIPLLHTFVEIKAWGDNATEAINEAFNEMDRINSLLSNYIPESDVSKINSNAGICPVPISPETADALNEALKFSKLSGGAFDLTIGPLLKLWGFNKDIPGLSGSEPDNKTIENTKLLVDYNAIEINHENNTGFLSKKGTWIDVGGFSKGYVADKAIALLQTKGIKNALVAAGGTICTIGKKPDYSEWTVGIKHPRNEDSFLTIIKLKDRAVSTSGDYENFYNKKGKRKTHIIDPRTGMPVETIQSASVIAPKGLDSDALSTVLFVLGEKDGIELIEEMPEVEALVVTNKGEVVFSTGWPVKVFTY